MSSLDCLDLCRLCLVKDSVSVPIFGGEGDARQIFLKIAACLPVKVARDDKLPKKICDQCVCKIELCYEFWNTTVNSEKQLIEWLGGSGVEDKQNYVSDVLNPNIMKQEQSNENRLDGTVMQVSGHQSNMAIGMMGNLALNMPIIISTSSQQQISSVPMDTSCNSVQAAQPLPGPSSQTSHSQNQVNSVGQEEEESTEEDDNTDDDGDAEEGLPVKEESEEDVNTNRSIEPTTFVNVSLACDEAGPSGLQQQKISEMPEMTISQTTDGDPKSGSNPTDPLAPTFLTVKVGEDYFLIPQSLSTFLVKDPREITDITTASINNRKEEKENKCNQKLNQETYIENIEDIPLKLRVKKKSKKEFGYIIKNNKRLKKTYTCQICQLTFDCKSKLTNHTFKHSNSRPHKCKICLKDFKTGGYLSKHMEIHVEPAQLHGCNLCDFKAKTKSYLKIHYIRKHTEDYNFSCEQCGKMFKVQSDYTTHMKDHDTESCVCDICGTSYSNKSSLYFHKHYKHKTRVKEFECQTCKKKFKSQKNLENHMELHKVKYVCEQCGMEFKSKYGLTKHLRTHSGEKSYLCAICGKTFGCLSSQKIHLLIHVGERPYVCDICGQSFTQRSPMMLHRKKHPGAHPPPPPIKITDLLHNVQDKIVIKKSAKK